MEPIKIKKENLAAILKANLAKHEESFEKAWQAYNDYIAEQVKTAYRRAQKGADVHRLIIDVAAQPIPRNYRKEYERIIQAVELHDEPHFLLTEREFAQYVRDDWTWKRDFVTTSANYGTASAEEVAYYVGE